MRQHPRITVFTPAYNRSHTLPKTLESLKRQKNKQFKWLIVDDGSTDNTKKLVQQWLKEDYGFEIKYIYKENGGMHTAHNVAYENIDTELNICIDSDDCLAEDAIDKILTFWDSHEHENYAGIIGLDSDLNGKLIGKDLGDLKETTLSGYYNQGGFGDKKLVYRTDIINEYPPYPVFEGERYVGLNYKYILIDQNYKLLVLNEVLCNVEYQLDGSTNNMWKQYYNNPKGFAFLRKFYMQYNNSLKRDIMDCIHYVSSSLLANNPNFIKESPKKLLTILCIPFGYVFKFLVIRKGKTL
ncbi:glycosyltransferase family 2 protein [Thomasclavelia cocleata]|uniref:glycosyltransferase family 2 protein n=1 Tax=Thomasclavelia cocleata TaxID=69824 RepID=UPI002430ACE5|nr:glycosyltransferase family A protein [Thomasclavelia cocleata]